MLNASVTPAAVDPDVVDPSIVASIPESFVAVRFRSPAVVRTVLSVI